MESLSLGIEKECKSDLDSVKTICRCCLSTEKRTINAVLFDAYFKYLAEINVTQSDGLPQWVCVECSTLLQKAVRFKQKIIKAHEVLYEYSSRCAPFPIDGQDAELSKYSNPHLSCSSTLVFDTCGRSRMGFQKVLEHEKVLSDPEFLYELPLVADKIEDDTEYVKQEDGGFSDYEDNITLDEIKSVADKIIDEHLQKLVEQSVKEEPEVKRKKLKKKSSKDKKKKTSVDKPPEPKTSVRKTIEVDPTKIRVVMLNPEEQIKQREEESKAGLKFPFQCNLCYKGFNFESKLGNHMSKHSPSRGKFKCTTCHMYLPTAYSYSVHAHIHTRRYQCVRCERLMTDRASIIEHYRSQHEGVMTVHTCHICGKISNNNKTHRGHLRNHHNGDRPKCDQCGKTFVNKDSLTEHMLIHQGVKNHECTICFKKFRTRTQIKLHQLRHTDAKNFYCVECDVRFKSAHNLKQHLQKSLKHKDEESFEFACASCPRRFPAAALLERHRRVQHERARPHACPACPRALATRASLAKHARTVHAPRPPPDHVCHTCGKRFRGKSVLVNHVRTHTGEKPYECGECGRRFTQSTAMRTHHKLVHLKIKRGQQPPAAKLQVKPEMAELPKIDMFTKEEPQIIFESWNRQDNPEVFFRVTAGP